MADPTLPTNPNQIDIELAKAKTEVKQKRVQAIGDLLDKATDVLYDVLDSPTTNQRAKIEAASLAVNLYIQQENADRQDKALDIQQKRLELEEKKLVLPGGPLFQQNNLYVANQQPTDPQLLEIERQALLDRKKAQDALLGSYLKQTPTATPDTGDNIQP